MKFEIISVYEKLDDYIKELERPNANAQAFWEKHAIEPFWSKLSEYAPTDIGNRKPKPVADIGRLRKQVKLLKRLDLAALSRVFEQITSVLTGDEGTMTIALYPIDNYWVRMAQNGVLGTCMWGHIIISLDPLTEDFERWIPYVFGHEYYHNVWGRYWHRLHSGELGNAFVNDLLCDGLADTFSLGLHPELKPKWLYDMSEEAEKKLWNEHYSLLIDRTDVNYNKYMLGDDIDIPWCAGFAIGFRIAQQYLKSHPNTSIRELLEKRPIDIFNESGYAKRMKR